MLKFVLPVLLVATVSRAQSFAPYEPSPAPCGGGCAIGSDGRTFAGLRGGLGIPAGASGVSPQLGFEVGLAPREGFGLGLRGLLSTNPPPVSWIGDARYAYGFALDMRMYIPAGDRLQLYPLVAIGFLTGPDNFSGENLVLPIMSGGFGGRLDLGPIYAGFDFGMALPDIPNFSFTIGWQGDTATKPRPSFH